MKEIEEDIQYFLKKMRWSRKELDEYLKRSPRSHAFYKSERWLWNILFRIYIKFIK